MADISIADTSSPTLMDVGKTIHGSVVDSGLICKWVPVTDARMGEVLVVADLSYRFVDLAAGTATMINTLGGAVYHAEGEEVVWDLDIGDMDTEQISYVRLVFTHTQANADTPIFKIRWSTNWLDDLGPLTAVTGAAITTTYTTQTFGAHTCTATANAVEVTLPAASSGIIPASSFPNTPRLLFGVELDAYGGIGADELALTGFYLWYHRR